MRIAYFDCFSGAAGDMIVAALLDAGASYEQLQTHLAGLKVPGFACKAEKVRKQGFAATKFDVIVDPDAPQPHRHLHHIEKIILDSDLAQTVKDRTVAIFRRLGQAEAKAHGTSIEKVHFHEVGAIDAIVDIVSSVICLDLLGIEEVRCSPLVVGSGTVRCEHGLMPVPAPGTAGLIEGVPIAASEETGELLTPTGAAILTTLCRQFGPMPAMTIAASGSGAGTRDGKTRPNLLRIFLGSTEAVGETDEVVVLEANLDDATGQVIGLAAERLLEAGALDVFCTAITMKKGRPAVMLTVLAAPPGADTLEAILFEQTPTFGVRRYTVRRRKLHRQWQPVETPFGVIRIKTGQLGEKVISAAPEYEDCRQAAQAAGVAVREVIAAAQSAWQVRGR
jgi:pyridinium-3,5-bisthiocarboxylic acid mononucleotide nickel chelatase